jgi:hypothetical protein
LPHAKQEIFKDMLNTRRILIAVAGLSLMCGLASASTLEETFTGSATSSTNTDFAGLLTATQFNPAWGTLTSVEIDVNSAMSTDLQVVNNDSSVSSGTVHTQLQIFVQDAGNDLNGGTFSTGAGVIAYCAPNVNCIGGFSYTLNAGKSIDSGALASSSSQDVTYTLAAILSEFEGTGTETLHSNTLTGTTITNSGGNTTAVQNTFANVTGDVIYTYTAPPSGAPEPATLFLMGSALVGVGVLRKRFKA